MADAGMRVQMCVTSPPYWGLRDYSIEPSVWGGRPDCEHVWGEEISIHKGGPAGETTGLTNRGAHQARNKIADIRAGQLCQCGAWLGTLGLEPDYRMYVEHIVEVMELVRQVLADDGTLWLNMGSSYMGSGSFYDDKRPIRSRSDAPAYGIDDKALPDSPDPDFAYFGLCDECLADFLSHRDHIVDTIQPTSRSGPLPSQIGRDSEQTDYVSEPLGASPPDALESTILQSWRQHRGVCSRCDSRATSLSGVRSSAGDARPCAHMALSTTDSAARESARHNQGKNVSGTAWLKYIKQFKPKDLVPTPWMVAMALQQAGWYLRSDIIWNKPNPMPESCKDRPTKSHEYLFLLSRQPRYYYDVDAIRETSEYGYRKNPNAEPMAGRIAQSSSMWRGAGDRETPVAGGVDCTEATYDKSWRRNKRSVWTIPTEPYPEAHFATFPRKLIEPCILAGSRKGDTVLDPFLGSGTTAQVAEHLGRQWIGCEIKKEYLVLQRERLRQQSLEL